MGDMEARIINKIDKMDRKMQTMKDDIVKSIKGYVATELKAMEDKLNKRIQEKEEQMEAKIFALEKEKDDMEQKMADMKDDATDLYLQLVSLKRVAFDARRHAVDNEQYSRKCNVKILGLKEETGENCVERILKVVKDKLGIEMKPGQIVVAHRVKSKKQPYPIIARMDSHTTKMTLLKARSKLKGSGVVIADDLFRDLMGVYHRVRNDDRVKDAWTWNGRVLAKTHDGRIYNVPYGVTLADILHDNREPMDTEAEGKDHETTDNEAGGSSEGL